MNLNRKTLTTLSIVVLLSGAQMAVAQKSEPAAAKPSAIPSGEWERIKEGLRRAIPMPEPAKTLLPATPTTPAGMLRFDPSTGQTSAPPLASPQSLIALPNNNGNPGIEPKSAQRPAAAALPLDLEGPGATGARAAAGVSPAAVTPPSPYTTPYGYPFRTYGRLLLRFNDGISDYYYLCSASTASSHHMVSAGHCVYNHDIRNDGSNIAGWAAEVWAWVAETDVVDPVDHSNWPDFPYGVAKMTQETTYNNWINSSDLNWDFSFIDLDRRIGDHVGWIGREWGVNTSSLNFDGYPAQAPYVPSDNPFQYPGYDANNVIGYTCCRIQMNAYTYGGHSGGPVWRLDPGTGNRYLEGVNSTSNRVGYAEATLLTSQIASDLNSHIASDAAPVDRAQVIENVFDGSEKGLGSGSAQIGFTFPLTLNAFNAGYASAGDTIAEIYLTTDPNNVAGGTFIGTHDFGTLGAFTTSTQAANITIPTSVRPGTYYVGYLLSAALSQYNTDKNSVVIENATMRAYCNADTFEPDNLSSQAQTLAVGGSQAHSICDNNSSDPRTDKDWAKFTLPYSSSATISTSGFAGGDTTMTLYNSGVSQIDFNDDNGTNFYSTINRVCGTNPLPAGTYYVQIQSYLNRTTIPNYTLSLSAAPCPVTSHITVVPSLNPSTYGQAVNFTATVTSPNGIPTGTVTFYDKGVNVGTVPLVSGSVTVIRKPNVGAHSMVAIYHPTANTPWTTSTSAAVVTNVNPANTTTAFTSSLNPSVYGQSVTFTATVTPAFGGTASGTVTFKDGSNTLGTGTLSSNVATFATTALAGGSHTITAAYGGSTNTLASTSASHSQTVNKATSTTVVTSSLNPSVYGQTVTLTATITSQHGGSVSGTVTFKDGTTTLGAATVNTTTNKATYATLKLGAKTHTISAVYSGSVSDNGSTSANFSQVVSQATSSTFLTSSLNPSTHGNTVTFSAKITPAHGSTATGTVTFKDGTTTVGTGAVNSTTNTATLATSTLAVGTHSISAVYGGDTNVKTSTSNTVSQKVN